MSKYEFVAVDFDGTVCADAFPEVGAPNRAVIDYVKRLAADGSKIILYTSRENGTRKLLDEAVAFCKEQGIPLYAVNENPGNPHAAKIGLKPSDGRKVYADLYIDDKAINPAGIKTPADYKEEQRAAEIEEAAFAVMETLGDYAAYLWGDVLAAVVSAIFAAKIDAAEIEREEAAKRALLLAPGMTVDLTGENSVTVKIEGQAVSAGSIIVTAADMIENTGAAAEG
jgi:hypothetical protein